MASPLIERPASAASSADPARLASAALIAVTAAAWCGVAWLSWAFFTDQLQWRYVAEQSRVDAPWHYRIAGVWGGMEGSLLLFGAILGTIAVVAVRRPGAPVPAPVRWAAVMTVTAVVTIDVVLASPFERLDAPALRGFGMNPILEHPAMTVHPPILYVGLATAFGAALRAVGVAHPWADARRWVLATIGSLTAAMTLGAAWSYLEQGWGGYWAWDPVENTSLLVWLAALVALHVAPVAGARMATAVCLAPWLLAIFGSILVRSGITPSIHGFAEQRSVGWALLAVAVASALAAGGAVRQATPGSQPPGWPTEHPTGASSAPGDRRTVMAVLTAAAVVVVLAGTLAPVVSELSGGRSSAVRGEFYSRTVGPLALVGLPFLVGRLRRWRGWSTVAHGGATVLLTGIAASTFDRVDTVPIAAGQTVPVSGVQVANRGVEVGEGTRAGTDAVVASLLVDGRSMRPAIVVYPDRGGRLAEVAARTGPLTDVQVVLEGASDDGGVVVTVHVRSLMWLVWVGASIMTAATLAPAAQSGSRRRRAR